MNSSDIEWLSTAEAAKRLGITPRTLYRFMNEDQLAGYRFGRVIRLKATDIDEFIESSRICCTSCCRSAVSGTVWTSNGIVSW